MSGHHREGAVRVGVTRRVAGARGSVGEESLHEEDRIEDRELTVVVAVPTNERSQRRDGESVDLDSTLTLLRYNDFENDPFSLVDGCTPERTPAGALANRLDLAPKNAECAFKDYDYTAGHPWG